MPFVSKSRSHSIIAAALVCVVAPTVAFCAPNSRALRETLVVDYPPAQVGQVMFKTDYTRITVPGVILAVRLPGI